MCEVVNKTHRSVVSFHTISLPHSEQKQIKATSFIQDRFIRSSWWENIKFTSRLSECTPTRGLKVYKNQWISDGWISFDDLQKKNNTIVITVYYRRLVSYSEYILLTWIFIKSVCEHVDEPVYVVNPEVTLIVWIHMNMNLVLRTNRPSVEMKQKRSVGLKNPVSIVTLIYVHDYPDKYP